MRWLYLSLGGLVGFFAGLGALLGDFEATSGSKLHPDGWTAQGGPGLHPDG